MGKLSLHTGQLIGRFVRDRRGNAAVEFAFIVPLMLVLFFGTVEFSSAVSANRKVTLAARNLSDLVSQSSSVTDNDLTNFNTTGSAIMNPFPLTTLKTRVSEIYIDPATLSGKVIWSKGTGLPNLASGSTIVVPTALQVAGTYLIYSEVNYQYVPAVGYVMGQAGVALSDQTFTRPRVSLCVLYGTPACGT
ncbi:MAG: pilus assembly protein [Bradyrhizobium sp.]|nr:pilus assembly protein [Bradyrhizobium sp.]